MKNKFKTRVCNINDKQHLPFLKSYKFLFEDKNYQNLPYQAKAMYTYIANKQIRVLKSENRHTYIDKNGDPFVIYSIKDLENDLKLSNSSAKKYKRILIEYELVSTTNRGMHIYVKTPKLSNNSLTYADGKKLSFFHMPKFFDTNPNYKNASLLARLVYTLQKERFTLTLTNVDTKKPSNYIDEKGRVFCTYANQSLAKMLNVCEKKIIDAKKELEALGLLKQKKQGFNEPNRLYLYTPLHSEQLSTDEFLNQNLTVTSESKYVLVPPEKSMKGCIYKRHEFKNTARKGLKMQSSNTEFSNTVISNTYNPMYSMYSMYLTDNVLKQTNDTNNTYELTRKEMKLKPFKFSKPLKAYLMNFSSNDLSIVLKKLATAKNHFNQNYDTNFALEDIDTEILNMLKRVKVVMHDNTRTVEDMGGYFYQSTINEFKAYEIKQIEERYDNKNETVAEFNQRWLKSIEKVSRTLKNNKIECTPIQRSESLFTHQHNQYSENNQYGYVDEKGVPY
ncbi:replication initiator protein A [Staphylococcus aureus]|uniref:replication initiator protein A n=1 Tax=Staphylococcus aureus TaxID=1280 RepID=UPI001BFE2C4D|nr:replication initiator protein A [Staphylococcus aureus]